MNTHFNAIQLLVDVSLVVRQMSVENGYFSLVPVEELGLQAQRPTSYLQTLEFGVLLLTTCPSSTVNEPHLLLAEGLLSVKTRNCNELGQF